MTARILDGRAIARQIYDEVATAVGVRPDLVGVVDDLRAQPQHAALDALQGFKNRVGPVAGGRRHVGGQSR